MSSMLALRWTRVNSYAARFRRNPRASGGGHITRDLLGGMPARVRCGGRNVCLAEHPPPKPVTDNLDNFSNRGDSYCLSNPSTHKIGLLPLFLVLRRSSTKVIAV